MSIEIKYYCDEHGWAITRCPQDTSTSKDHFDNNMPYVGSGACSDCSNHIENIDDGWGCGKVICKNLPINIEPTTKQ